MEKIFVGARDSPQQVRVLQPITCPAITSKNNTRVSFSLLDAGMNHNHEPYRIFHDGKDIMM